MTLPSDVPDAGSGAIQFQDDYITPSIPSSRSQSSRHFAIFVFFAIGTFLFANFLISTAQLPRYASWTGVGTLEDKLDMFARFARHGPVDAVLLGSSIVDFGVSAEALSDEVSRQSGKPYRVFNFSTGAATLKTFPVLYRLVRTTTKPKALFLIIPVEPDRGNVPSPRTPEAIMLRSPIASSLHNRFRLALSAEIWALPVVRFASPLRDLALYGNYNNRVATHADIYELGVHGDMLSFTVNTDREGFLKSSEERKNYVLKRKQYSPRLSSEQNGQTAQTTYLSEYAVKDLQELANLARNDGVSLTVIAHDRASALANQDSAYNTALKLYYEEIVRTVPMKSINFIERFVPAPFEISDPIHLNQHGARRFARLLAKELLGRSRDPEPAWKAPDFRVQKQDLTFNAWSAVVTRQSTDPSGVLELEFVQTWQTPPLLPGERVQIAVRTPDNRDLFCQSQVLRRGCLQAETSMLPDGDNVFWIRVLSKGAAKDAAINLPLASFRWLERNSSTAFAHKATSPPSGP